MLKSEKAKQIKKKQKAAKLPKTVAQSIPYENIYENGTIETIPGTFTRTYPLQDVNFKIAPDDEQVAIFTEFGRFLNAFDPSTKFQICIYNHSADKKSTMENIRFNPMKDGLNKYRGEMNNILLDKMAVGKNNLTQEKFLTIAIDDNSVAHAMTSLDLLDKQVDASLRKIAKETSTKPISIEDRLKTIHSIYNQDGESVFFNDVDENENPIFNLGKLVKAGLTTKDVIGNSLEFATNYFKTGNTYGRALYLESVPTWLSTEFISDISDVACNLLISLNYTPIDPSKAVKMVKDQMISIDAEIAARQKEAGENGYTLDLISPELMRSQEQARDLMNDMISRDQKMYFITFSVVVFAESKDALEENTKLITTVANKHLCPLKTLHFQQEYGLNSSMPLATNRLSTKRMYTTESASIFIPYTSQELHQKNGIFYGLNATTKNMILYSRMNGRNFNGLIFGESGSGKSFTAKCEMLSVLLRSDKNQVYVIDPESEYSPMAEALHGEIINLSPGSKSFINPLDMDIDYDGANSPLSMKSDYIISMIEIMLGKDRILDPQSKSMIDRCVKRIYLGYLDHMDKLKASGSTITCDKNAMPTLNNLYNELLSQPEPEARALANIIEVYSTGSLATFAHRSTVNTNAKFVVYDINSLGTGMKDLGLYVCLNDIWNKMIENRKSDIWTWFYIDEFYLLLQSNSTAKFLMEIWKRARKWNGVPTGIMQNTEDLLRSSDSRNIINNTSFVIMLSLPKIDRSNLSDLLQISEAQLEYITNGTVGHGLIYNGKTVLPFENDFPTDSMLYKIMSSSGTKDNLLKQQASA